MEYRVAAASAEDEAFLKELFFDVRVPEFLPLQLLESALAQLLDNMMPFQVLSYVIAMTGVFPSRS